MPLVSDSKVWRAVISIAAMVTVLSCADGASPYRVGFSSTLSGSESSFGIDIRDGALLAVEDLNARDGGMPIELIIRDDRGSPSAALANNREFAEMGIEAVIGHATSSVATVVLPFLESRDMVFVGASISSPAFTGRDDALFRVATTSRVEAVLLARYLAETRGAETIAAIYDGSNVAYARPFYEDFKREYERTGGRVADPIVYTSDDERYDQLVRRAIDSAPDVTGLFLITNPIHSAALSQLYRQRVPDGQIISSRWANNPDLISYGGRAVDGILFADMYDFRDPSGGHVAFIGRYRARFGSTPSFVAMLSYETVLYLYAALEHRDAGESLHSALSRVRSIEGIQRTVRFNRYGDAVRPSYVTTVVDGMFTTLDGGAPSQ